ncbi:hypothetical protein RCH09_001829 [Actimicrobium sp. GrIS 1.19]|uniref:hypothetical protein n=1 Tax=Actimicrobium sp. GrIS 1.19 TaxID=3071708 RepID=UPI002E08DF6A|nr:hypothetical protein [Actimicrobium sp. GrIS 1.19]
MSKSSRTERNIDRLPPIVTPEVEIDHDAVARAEHHLDQALGNSFPASDPVADLPKEEPADTETATQDALEHRLDEAVAMTFPASDPIAISVDPAPVTPP